MTLNTNPILIIEDDPDDQILLKSIFRQLSVSNELCFFSTTPEALSYLRAAEQKPFLILCSTNLPVNDGINFKMFLEEHQIKLKGIPFIFLSTQVHAGFIRRAYASISLQGIFIKPGDYAQFTRMIELVYTYWQCAIHPDDSAN